MGNNLENKRTQEELQALLAEQDAVIKKLELEITHERTLREGLEKQLEENEKRISDAVTQINMTSASRVFKLAYLLHRWRHQGLSSDKEQRKAFRKWLLRKANRAEEAVSYNPLMTAINLLETKPVKTKEEILWETITSNEALQSTLEQPYQKMDIIMLGVISYQFRHQRPQHFAQRLAQKGHRVFYVNSDYDAQYHQDVLEENLWQTTFDGQGQPAIWSTDWLQNLDHLKAQFDRMILENAIRDAVVIVDFPNWIHGAEYLREHYGFRMITDYMDDFTGFLNPAEEVVADNCRKLLRSCDSVVSSSQFLFDIAAQYTDKITMIRNGTEYAFFHKAAGKQSEEKKRPVIGYYGAISDWFHADIVCHCAQRFPDCDVVLVGNVTAHEEQLKAQKNIQLIGEIPYVQLLPWVESFDVCLIPFDTSTDLIKATNPVKFYEYLSAGKKVVATEIPELEPYRNQYVYMENDPDKFCDAVEACLKGTDTLASEGECFAFARESDWDVRTDVLEQAIASIYPKISVVMLCYNQLDYTKLCVESVLKNTAYPNYELVIVDNNSSDDTAAYLTQLDQQYSHIKIVLNKTNRGFAGGNNDGIAVADGDYVLLLNNDTLVTRGWLTGMLKHFANDASVGLVGPITNSIGNEARIMVPYTEVNMMPLYAHGYTMEHMGEQYPHDGILAMFCLMISRAAYEKIGPLDENYGIGMFEDDDYSVASVKAGFRNVMAEDVFIHHFGSKSFKKLEDETYRQTFEENKQYFEDKWKDLWRCPHYRPGVQ